MDYAPPRVRSAVSTQAYHRLIFPHTNLHRSAVKTFEACHAKRADLVTALSFRPEDCGRKRMETADRQVMVDGRGDVVTAKLN